MNDLQMTILQEFYEALKEPEGMLLSNNIQELASASVTEITSALNQLVLVGSIDWEHKLGSRGPGGIGKISAKGIESIEAKNALTTARDGAGFDQGAFNTFAFNESSLAIPVTNRPTASTTPVSVSMPVTIELTGRLSARSQGRAELRVTPSRDLEEAYQAMQSRVKALEDFIIPLTNRLGIGGNFPPEPLEDSPVSGRDLIELSKEAALVRRQEVVPTGDLKSVIDAPKKIESVADKIRAFLQRRGEDFSGGIAKKAGEHIVNPGRWDAVQPPIHALLLDLWSLLTMAADAIMTWIHLLISFLAL